MNRAMFSGVSGMKSHQTKMDVIGNNIANVNTYGYKSQRAVFSDIYYQTLRSASAGTGTRGGQNPSMIGYGSSMLGVQSQMTQSSTQNTGFGLDVAIAGEGYLQVRDPDGNTFYTKAGMLDYDSQGYLVDINGNFVLGANSADGKPGSDPIKLDKVGSVDASQPKTTVKINDVNYTLTGSNAVAAGNVSFSFASSASLPIGQRAKAVLSGNSIDIALNANETFKNVDDLNNAINEAITEANGGKQHAGGTFTLTNDAATPWANLTGKQIAGTNFAYDKGTIDLATGNPNGIFGGFKFKSVGNGFITNNSKLDFELTRHPASGSDEAYFTLTAKDPTTQKTYTCDIKESQMGTPGEVILKSNNSSTDCFTMTYPTLSSVLNSAKVDNTATWNSKPMDITSAADQANSINKLLEQLGFKSTIKDSDLSAALAAGNVELECLSLPNTADPQFELRIGSTKVQFFQSECGKTKQLTGATGDTVEDPFTLTIPSLDKLLSACSTLNFNKIVGIDTTDSVPSKDQGLSEGSFTLAGGTEGGLITLDKLSSISIGSDGAVTVSNPDKGNVVVGRVCLANFANPSGLAQAGTNYFSATANSGKAQVATPGTDGTGALKSSSLEMSNVDLSQEFADMITTQRGFQANSRIITVSDTMLEELINLKR